jgi:uncharacterized protein
MRLEIHVRPNAARTVVGGTYDRALVVRVAERAENGRATAAALAAVADALSVPRGAVTLVRGTTSRRKLLEVTVGQAGEGAVKGRIEQLQTASSKPGH